MREQGHSDLALASLVPLPASDAEGQFLAVQNQFDASLGRLDYSVTLVRFGLSSPDSRVAPFSTENPLLLGRVAVNGISGGSFHILPEDVSGSPFLAVSLGPSGELATVDLAPLSGPQATVKVGDVITPELHGQIIPPGPGDDPLTDLPPAVLTITFWRSGATPTWRGGNDLPLATFKEVSASAGGAFRIADIASSLVPPGVYDLRVKGRGTLASLVPGVDMPASGSPGDSAPIASAGAISLADGDIDGNNTIDHADLEALKASFGRVGPEPEFNANADFNGDNLVDVLDFARLAQNFGGMGE